MAERYSYSRCYSSKNHNSLSFSSTLLDAIYRSVEAETTAVDSCRDPAVKMKHNSVRNDEVFKSKEDMENYRRACMIDKWMEKKKTTDNYDNNNNNNNNNKVKKPSSSAINKASRDQKPRLNSNSKKSSSSSSPSSSEAESFLPRPKPVRTGCTSGFEKMVKNRERSGPKQEGGGGFSRTTKSRALKIYGDLKKARQQPISPGGKLAVFLNSLFSGGGNLKKKKTSKIVSNGDDSPSLESTITSTTTCSSASSFSRTTTSCLSKTPSSSRKTSDAVKRSVRFSPVNMIIDEDPKSYGQEVSNQDEHNGKKTSKDSVKSCPFDQDSDEDDDDVASYASSDLFELDNLSSIGLVESNYRDELPVYETTRLDSSNIELLLRMR